MIPERYENLIAKLMAKSENETIKWSEDQDTHLLLAKFGQMIVRLDRYGEQTGPRPEDLYEAISFAICQASGDIVDRFEVRIRTEGFQEMDRLFDLARVKARGVKGVIHEIETQLDSMDDGIPF